jgi:hypothetical protein
LLISSIDRVAPTAAASVLEEDDDDWRQPILSGRKFLN